MIKHTPTYISLFSSAGVGCFGFKEAGYLCIATCEILAKRLHIQKLNGKCSREEAYIGGDLRDNAVKQSVYDEIRYWQERGNDGVDVLIATPPCQGMSALNQKKTPSDHAKNSLVAESVEMIKAIRPKIFVIENVKSFWNTLCTDKGGHQMPIGNLIGESLGKDYDICRRVLNFKDYGGNSSRTRSLIIGVAKGLSCHIPPFLLFPDYQKPPTLRQLIGHLPQLGWGEYADNDFFHSFRTYPKEMEAWIELLGEGESAFGQSDTSRIPPVSQKMKDKFSRQRWDATACCVHTRNDQLGSQNTVHPNDNRVFSIRELMQMMSIPHEFRWLDKDLPELNRLSEAQKREISKKEELSIRRSIGEAVPTVIFRQIAQKAAELLKRQRHTPRSIKPLSGGLSALTDADSLKNIIRENREALSPYSLSMLIEASNPHKDKFQAYFTRHDIIAKITEDLPDFDKDEITVLEPSAGCGNFVPFLFKKYAHIPQVNLWLMDIDGDMVAALQELYEKGIPHNFHIRFIQGDFLEFAPDSRIDLIVGNPPFGKAAKLFAQHAASLADWVSLIMPKSLLGTPDYEEIRKLVESRIIKIWDFGEQAFAGVKIETLNMLIAPQNSHNIAVESLITDSLHTHKKSYLFDKSLPHWVIYRNQDFDEILGKMEMGIFGVFRDREIVKSMLTEKSPETVRVIKSRNISQDGTLCDISDYDTYIPHEKAAKLGAYRYLNRDDVYMMPNLTLRPRIMKKEKGYIANGSVALLIPKTQEPLSRQQMAFIGSREFWDFYAIARNRQTRSLNIDALSVFWIGRLIRL